MTKVGIGQDSHRFEEKKTGKKLILGGVNFNEDYALAGNSDADVILHSITNAISGVTGVNILGKIADDMCKSGIVDGESYIIEALKYLKGKIVHVSVSIECVNPKITPMISEIKQNIARILGVQVSDVGITATTGDKLTDFGRGLGIACFACVTIEI